MYFPVLSRFLAPTRAAVVAAGLALLSAGLPAAAQTLDPTFAALDTRVLDVASSFLVRATVADGQGRVLVGGDFDFLAGARRGNVARLLPTGAPDPTFNPGGDGANGLVDAILVLPNGQIVIGGTFTSYNGVAVGRLAQLNTDGTLDPAFNPGGSGADYQVLALTRDAQGRLLVGGTFTTFNGQPGTGIVRLTPGGTLDAGFVPTPGWGADPRVFAVATDAADRVLVGGIFTDTTRGNLLRLLPGGGLDPSFNPGGRGAEFTVRRVLVAGRGGLYNRANPSVVLRLTSSGTPDPGFTVALTTGQAFGLALTAGGQILVAGRSLRPGPGAPLMNVLRLNPTGSVDAAFAGAAVTRPGGSQGTLYDVAATGPTTVVGGAFTALGGNPTIGVARLSAAGTADGSYGPVVLDQHTEVEHLARLSTDQLLIAGFFGQQGGLTAGPLARLSANGVPDPGFQPDPALGGVTALAVEPGTDRVVVADHSHVHKLTASGDFNPTFNDGVGADAPGQGLLYGIMTVLPLPGGSVLVGGDFTRYDGQVRTGLVRLTASGAVDPAFIPPVDSSYYVASAVASATGSVLITSYSLFSSAPQLQWIDAAGAPLPTFNSGQPVLGATASVLPDGSFFLAGAFTFNGVPYAIGTYKFTAAGQPDPSFALDPALAGQALGFVLQPDGKLLSHETFPLDRWRRLLPNGMLDAGFPPLNFGTGYSGETSRDAVFQTGGKLVVAGGFKTVNGAYHPNLVRFTGLVTGLASNHTLARLPLSAFPVPAHQTLTLRRADSDAAYPAAATLLDALGRTVREWTLGAGAAEPAVSVAGLVPGTYVVRVVSAAGVATQRVVVE